MHSPCEVACNNVTNLGLGAKMCSDMITQVTAALMRYVIFLYENSDNRSSDLYTRTDIIFLQMKIRVT